MKNPVFGILCVLACVAALGSGSAEAASRLQAFATADSLMAAHRFPEALAAYETLRTCGTEAHAPDSLDARFHRDYGWALVRCDQMDKAGPELTRALEGWAAVAGDTSAGYAIALERYARWRLSSGDYKGAYRDFSRAWEILLGTSGAEDPETLWAEHGLAQALDGLHRREEALQHMEHVFAVRQRTLSPDDLNLAWTCHDYAVFLHVLGRPHEAAELYRRAYVTRRDRLPALSCQSGWGYASCLVAQGDFRTALQVMSDVRDVVQGDPDLIKDLSVGTTSMAAYISVRLGDVNGTEHLQDQFLKLVRQYGVDERTWLLNLYVQEYLLEQRGEFQAAIDTLNVRLQKISRMYGPDSPMMVPALARLARLYEHLENHSAADSVFAAGLGLADPVEQPALFGSFASDYVTFLTSRGRMADAQEWGRRGLAAVASLPPLHSVRSKVEESAGRLRFAREDPLASWDLTQRAAAASLDRYRLNLQALGPDQIVSYSAQELTSLDLLITLLDEKECRAGEFVETAWTFTLLSRGSLLDELTQRRDRGMEPDSLRSLKRRVSQLLSLDPVQGTEPIPHALLAQLEGDIAQVEAQNAAYHLVETCGSSLDLAAVRKTLPARTTLLAYVEYHSEGTARLGAFVLGPRAEPRFHELGRLDVIQDLVARLQRHMGTVPQEVILDPEGAELAYRTIAGQLRGLLLDPVFGENVPADLIVIPTGALWGLNFMALPGSGATYLVERMNTFSMVQSERELLSTDGPSSGAGLLAVGGVDFSDWGKAAPAALPKSLDEARDILATWREERPGEPGEILMGQAVQESTLPSRMCGRQVVHLATHGFQRQDPVTGQPFTGLLLAKPKTASSSNIDGAWTELEVALEDFSTVDLVFLSSCLSSGGKTLSGEKLVGLYRAFRLAGAHSAVLSVWDVGDRPSHDWCALFYRRFLKSGSDAGLASLQTTSEILTDRRSAGRPTHPYYWGSFVAVGY